MPRHSGRHASRREWLPRRVAHAEGIRPLTGDTLRLSRLVLAATLVAASPAVAQRTGTIEIGGFGRFTRFDGSYNLPNHNAVGARLGFFVVRNVELEASAALTPTSFRNAASQRVHQWDLAGKLLYNVPAGEHGAVIVGGGITENLYRSAARGNETGIGALAGFRLGLGEALSIRVDGTYDFVGQPYRNLSGASNAWHWGINVGLSYLSGQRFTAARAPLTPAPAPAPPPADADTDAVPDVHDRCPDTPTGEQADANGCSASQRDNDKDGVKGFADRCPETPAGDQVDANGCTLPKDADRDSVADASDRCPDTPAGETVDANGCRILFESLSQRRLILHGVNFETGKAALTPESAVILDEVAGSLAADSEIRVEVQGHTDSRGSRALNRRLSLARANAVRQYLIEHGVPADRLSARGYGPDRPLASDMTDAGRAQNRRVELDRLN